MNMNSCQVNTGYHSPLQFPSKTSWPDLSGKWRLYRVHEIPPMSISPCLMALSQTASTSFSSVSFALTRIVLMRPRLCANTALKKPVRTSYHLRDVRKQWDRIHGVFGGVFAIVLMGNLIPPRPDGRSSST